jgi:hypothetical protein
VSLLIRRFAAISLLLTAAACGSETSFKSWQEPRLRVSFDVPADWTMYGDGGTGQPAGFALFVHEPSTRVEDQWIGPNIMIHRLSRVDSEYPSPGYRDRALAPAESAFNDKSPGISSATVAGLPSREFSINYKLNVPKKDGAPAEVPMRSAALVIQKPEAYYILEFRSNQRDYGQFFPVYDRAKRTLRFN